MRNKKLKIALALGAGGAKGFAHIGVLKALKEFGVDIDIITGCSMGAIVGACYVMGRSPEELEARAVSLTAGSILDVKFPNNFGFIKGDKAERAIRQLLGVVDTEPLFEECKIPFGCVAADIASAEVVPFTSGNLIPAVRASFSIGGVFRPVEINGRKLLDGGIFCRVPVDLARKMGADVVIAVDCIGKTEYENIDEYKYADTIARVFTVMDYKVSEREIHSADYLISLSQPSVSMIRVKNVQESIDVGYRSTVEIMGDLKRIIGKN